MIMNNVWKDTLMMTGQLPACPNCHNHNILIKYEATYVYSYSIDSDSPGLKNTYEFLPYMFDKREQKDSQQYLECLDCGKQYPFYLNEWNEKIGLRELQQAINISNQR